MVYSQFSHPAVCTGYRHHRVPILQSVHGLVAYRERQHSGFKMFIAPLEQIPNLLIAPSPTTVLVKKGLRYSTIGS